MVRTSLYERHPDVYQDKFKRAVVLVEADEDQGCGDQEVAAEWTRGASPVSCKWVKPQGPPRGFDFDVTKAEQIFDLLLKEKQLKVPEGHKIPTAQELNGKPYCKWHNTFTHATNDCRVWRQQWDGDEVEVIHADDSAEISMAGMNVWETSGQEPLSGINLDDCERIDVTKDGVRLVLSTGLTV
ncbi:hypothetical protein QYE76_014533 [Lolium multiflorum]|uniref:Uncharacterized protein n=1 Tax=Lolium multiflorum TaxID=4521 RepID=A0AAD8U0V6_LOLMU|nr:hypothetical protein QYE76_014533 [Lolium multiflorum]